MQDIIQFAGKAFLAFALLAYIVYLLEPYLQRLVKLIKGSDRKDETYTCMTDEEVRQRQAESLEKMQEEHRSKASDFNERILKPREEAKKKKQEEEYYKFSGPAWKGSGHALGGGSQQEEGLRRRGGGSREAAAVRQLPDHVVNSPKPPEQSPPKQRKKIELPNEPPDGTSGSITILIRSPQGRTHRRRFMQSDTIQVLLDYMTTVGYHQQFYTVVTSYPRHSLSTVADQTLESVGITRDVALNVEAKEME